jgi:hypothetical protein
MHHASFCTSRPSDREINAIRWETGSITIMIMTNLQVKHVTPSALSQATQLLVDADKVTICNCLFDDRQEGEEVTASHVHEDGVDEGSGF